MYYLILNLSMFDKINLKFILNHQIEIFIIINYNQGKRRLNNNVGHKITIEIVDEIRAKESKNVK